MQIKKVRIGAFGPFVDKDLELAPGMTVIFGPNEAGKTSWHAALYAGLCGVRRGRGQPKVEDRDFAALHRPWDGDTWRAGVLLKLANGQEIELDNDLDGRVDCRAMDVQLGRDVSGEIMNDGSPDGSMWLGLDRRAFLATACVGQAEILSVRSRPSELQDHLQRAAATAGTDETAAAALDLLNSFKSEHVGLLRANSTRPLQTAITLLKNAEMALENAQTEHGQYLVDAEAVEQLEERAGETSRELAVFDAAASRRNAVEMKARLDRAAVLEEKYAGSPAPSLAADEELARDVAAAVTAWEKIPVPPDMEGPSSDEVRTQLKELPAGTAGDLVPDPSVVAARDAAMAAKSTLAQHMQQRPADPEVFEASITDQELRDLARDIAVTAPEVDPALQARRHEATTQLAQSGSRKISLPLLLTGIALIAVGGVAAALIHPAAALLAVVGVVLAVVAVVRRSDTGRLDALQAIVTIDAEGGTQLQTAEAIQRRRDAAIARLQALGLPQDAPALLGLAQRVSDASHQRALLDSWLQWKDWNENQAQQADQHLADALTARDVPVTADPIASADQYIADCAERAKVAELSGRRSGLEGQIAEREHLEQIARDATEARSAALLALRQAAGRCGLADGDPAVMVDELKQWLTQRTDSHGAHQVEVEERTELEGLLAGQSLEHLATAVQQSLERAERLETEVTAEELSTVVIPDDWEGELRRLRRTDEQSRQAADESRGRLAVLTKQLPSVAGAEEAVVAASAERSKVEDLKLTLDTTIAYLEEAQDRVHRDIAPVLAGSLQAWLPHVTVERYVEARVDPEELLVKVRGDGAPWREAQLLSQGTREQVYLLLRMAMVQHLTAKDECAPLILDDVTVQCDTTRTAGLLELLHTMSVDRQIILFSQEDDVRVWGEEHLGGAQDSLHVLDPAGVPV
jgi:hypothetical protein